MRHELGEDMRTTKTWSAIAVMLVFCGCASVNTRRPILHMPATNKPMPNTQYWMMSYCKAFVIDFKEWKQISISRPSPCEDNIAVCDTVATGITDAKGRARLPKRPCKNAAYDILRAIGPVSGYKGYFQTTSGDDADLPMAGIPYRIFESKTGKILHEGCSDRCGRTAVVFTGDQAKELTLQISSNHSDPIWKECKPLFSSPGIPLGDDVSIENRKPKKPIPEKPPLICPETCQTD